MREAIRIEGLEYSYPERESAILENIDLSIKEGEFVLVLGPSGSGKSTLLRAMNGSVPHLHGGKFRGRVSIFGEDTAERTPKDLAGIVGMVFQDPESQLVMTSPGNEVRFGLENISLATEKIERRIDESLEITNIEAFRNRFNPELSGGEKQKLTLASVIAMDPRIILLDEPTSQLDPKSAEEILAILRKFNEERGLTVVLVEHRLERCMQFADRVVLMDSGEIILDEPMDSYIQKAKERGSIFLPPVTRISDPEKDETAVTVKEARKRVHDALIEKRLGKKRVVPVRTGRTGRTLIRLKGVDFSYVDGKKILKNIDITIKEGEKIALMGRNGAGKSTLLKLLNGLLKSKRGAVLVTGKNTRNTPTSELAGTCGYLSQNPSDYLFQPTVEKEILLGVNKDKMDLDHVARIIELLSLERYLNTYPRDLSVGERERVALASILALQPGVLALDEPTRGLDYGEKEKLSGILNEMSEGGTACIVATHDVEFVTGYANRVIILGGDGKILADGVPKKVLPDSLLFSPQTNLATRGFEELGLSGNVIHPDELIWNAADRTTGKGVQRGKGGRAG